MLTIISPAKTIKEEYYNVKTTIPVFEKDARYLNNLLKKKSVDDLMKLMDISEKLALKNMERYMNFDKNPSYPSGYLFRGDVYRGLDADSFSLDDLEFANNHLRILSGMYGILKMTDEVKPYRLEMGIKLSNRKGENLYSYWGDRIVKQLRKELDDNTIINLASKEYSKVITAKPSKIQIIDVEFLEKRKGKYMQISFNSKHARGLMASYIIKNRINSPHLLKDFDEEGYVYSSSKSNENKLVFIR